MSKRKNASVEDPISPNLIPMIDIMFLLLLFFMLGADMAARETQEMNLPEANKAKEIDPNTNSTEPETIINIHHAPDGGVGCGKYDNKGVCRDKTHWKWTISGISYEPDRFKERLKILSDLSPEDAPDKDAKVGKDQGPVTSAFVREAWDKAVQLFNYEERKKKSGTKVGNKVIGIGLGQVAGRAHVRGRDPPELVERALD